MATQDTTDFNVDYVDEVHMQAFKQALENDDQIIDPDSTSNLTSPTLPGASSRSILRVRKVSAMSDFAPIQVRVKKRRRTHRGPEKRQEWVFVLVRWPLLLLLFLFIFFVFGAYVATRQCVNAWERLFAWRGRKGLLRKRLRSARNYDEWKQSAKTMDEYLKFDNWKVEDEDPYYDWRLIKRVRRSLRSCRENDDIRGLMTVLNTCMRSNFGGTESARLYSETFYGTKQLIETYIDEVQASLSLIRKSAQLSLEEKRQFFKSCNINFGSSALCLSGGASFGYYHFGIVKALLDSDFLPRVVAGTSAGGLVAALVCTRTDNELRQLLVPELAQKINACAEPFSIWFDRFRRTGARFDTLDWARKACYFTHGSLTFREAWLRTGRVLNVSVIPFDQYSPTKLLNYLTAPDTVIWTALLASAAVPGILNPVVLMQKTANGSIIPWSWGSRFKDGSLRVDIPLQALNLYFNVTHPIVSQVNPHVHLFFFAPRGSAGKPVAHSRGKGWRGGFVLSAAEQWLKLELTKNFKFIRDLELLPQLLGQDWSSVFLQRFDGAVTIWPRTRIKDWIRILSDPDGQELERMMRAGEIATWPKIHMISNRMRLEREIIRGRQSVRKALQRDQKDKISLDTDAAALRAVDMSRRTTQTAEELPIESEAERDFAQGSQRFFKRIRSQLSKGSAPPCTPMPGTVDAADVRHRVVRQPDNNQVRPRIETAFSFEGGTADDESGPLQPFPDMQERTLTGSPRKNPSFFARLRDSSFRSLPTPFGGSLKSESRSVTQSPPNNLQDEEWSSDSTSDNEAMALASSTLSLHSRLGEGNALGLRIGPTSPRSDDYDGSSRDSLQQDV